MDNSQKKFESVAILAIIAIVFIVGVLSAFSHKPDVESLGITGNVAAKANLSPEYRAWVNDVGFYVLLGIMTFVLTLILVRKTITHEEIPSKKR